MKTKIIIILLSTMLLAIFGTIMIYSASSIWAQFKFNNQYYFLYRQILFLLIGIILMYIITRIDFNTIKKYINHFFIISFILLIIVLIPGIGLVRGGARSWIGFSFITIQPSEFMKLALVLFISKYLSNYNKDIQLFSSFIKVLIFITFIFGFILLQPDLGTATVLLLSVFILLIINLVPLKYFLLIFISGVISLIPIIIFAPYRLQRINSYLDPWKDPLGGGFQIIQSLYALVPHSLFGTGLFHSKQKFYYLPEPHTDFIFSIIVEELGLIGIVLTLGLFLIIVITVLKTAYTCKDILKRNILIGIISILIIQVVINISVTIGLIPVTGITLPFISYGGSSLVLNFINIGIIINILKSFRKCDIY